MKRYLSVLLLSTASIACAGGHHAPPREAREGESSQAARLYEAGLAFADRGDWLRAEHYLNAAVRRGAPADRVVWHLVRICVESSRFRAALEHAESHLRQHPGNVELRFVVGTLHAALGAPEAARDALGSVTRADPTHAPAEYALGKLWARSFGDLEEAARHFIRYLELRPRGEHAEEVRLWLATWHRNEERPPT